MKTLSVQSIYAYMLCAGIKDIENRTWQTDHRGELLIHASGKTMFDIEISDFCSDKKALEIARKFEIDCENNMIAETILNYPQWIQNFAYFSKSVIYSHYDKFPEKPFFQSQAIIGKVELVNIVRNSKSIFAEKNCYHWIFKNAQLFVNPVLYIKGKIKLFDFSLDTSNIPIHKF